MPMTSSVVKPTTVAIYHSMLASCSWFHLAVPAQRNSASAQLSPAKAISRKLCTRFIFRRVGNKLPTLRLV